jgi:hypothetical protein
MFGFGTHVVQALSVLVVAAGLACSPTVDPAAKADIDRRLKLVPTSPQSYGPPAAPKPLPLAVGQWVQYKMVDEGGKPSFFTMKVVDELQGTYFIEYVTEAYTGKSVTQLHLYLGDRTNPATMDIRGVKVKDASGNVTEMPPAALTMMRSSWKGMLDLVAVRWQGLPQESVTVPAGNFASCYKGDSEGSFGPWKTKTRSWSHTSVPLSGLVRSQGLDKPTGMELVAFGEKGGVKEIP